MGLVWDEGQYEAQYMKDFTDSFHKVHHRMGQQHKGDQRGVHCSRTPRVEPSWCRDRSYHVDAVPRVRHRCQNLGRTILNRLTRCRGTSLKYLPTCSAFSQDLFNLEALSDSGNISSCPANSPSWMVKYSCCAN